MNKKRFGLLTAGGDCPGLNATIRAIVKTAREKYDMEAVGFRHGYRGILERDYVVMEPDMVSGILTQGGTILGTSREKVFKNEPGDERDKPAIIRKVYDELNLECLVVLGGNGTNKKAYKLQEAVGINAMDCPKPSIMTFMGLTNALVLLLRWILLLKPLTGFIPRLTPITELWLLN